MKKVFSILIAGVTVFAAASCTNEKNNSAESSSLTTINVAIADESGTKATLAETGGVFAFSSGDQIKIYNGRAIGVATTTTAANHAEFSIDGEYTIGVDGFVGFPANLVSDMSESGVTFTLPTSYTYAEVGNADASVGKVPCPMMGTYTAGSSDVVLKQAGAVVRFRLTNLKAGSVSFTFPTNVTGTALLTGVPSASDEGILAANLTSTGKTITITDVPAVADGSYIYVTLPVPTGTAPEDIFVTNEPSDASASRMIAVAGNSTPLDRASGWKLSARPADIATPKFKVGDDTYVVLAPGNLMAKLSPSYNGEDTAVATEWKFGGYFETIGASVTGGNYLFANHSSSAAGKWIDLFEWQGNSATSKVHGIISSTGHNDTYHGNVAGEDLYSGCWDGLEITNGNTAEYAWRPITNDEWNYLFNTRDGAVINGDPGWRISRATVAGTKGMLIFPDKATELWNEGTMGSFPDDKNPQGDYKAGDAGYYNFTKTYTSANMLAMAAAGIVFMPVTNTREGTEMLRPADARYWSSTGGSFKSPDYNAYRLGFALSVVKPSNDRPRWHGSAVRLVREVPAEYMSGSFGASITSLDNVDCNAWD